MRIKPSCEKCLYDKQVNRVKSFDRVAGDDFLKQVRYILDNRKEDDSAPYMVHLFNEEFTKRFGGMKDFTDIKKEYNDLMLGIEEDIERKIEASNDPLKSAIVYARIGNYIDFAAMNSVDKNVLMNLLEVDVETVLDNKVYESFCRQCEAAGNFLLITDNCGEIVLDKLFIRQLKKRFPKLKCRCLVRGEQALNDATVDDAVYVGLDKEAEIISNGTNITGTVIEMLPTEAKVIFDKTDVILSKGQGNYETMSGCGKKIFYAFLCKCDYFVELFNADKLEGMFIEEA